MNFLQLLKSFTGFFQSQPLPAPVPPPAPPTVRCGLMIPEFGIYEYEHRPLGLNTFVVPETDGRMNGATVVFGANAPVGTVLDVVFDVTQCDFFIEGKWVDVLPFATDFRHQPTRVTLPFHAVESGGYQIGLLLFDWFAGPARGATKFRFKGTMDIKLGSAP